MPLPTVSNVAPVPPEEKPDPRQEAHARISARLQDAFRRVCGHEMLVHDIRVSSEDGTEEEFSLSPSLRVWVPDHAAALVIERQSDQPPAIGIEVIAFSWRVVPRERPEEHPDLDSWLEEHGEAQGYEVEFSGCDVLTLNQNENVDYAVVFGSVAPSLSPGRHQHVTVSLSPSDWRNPATGRSARGEAEYDVARQWAAKTLEAVVCACPSVNFHCATLGVAALDQPVNLDLCVSELPPEPPFTQEQVQARGEVLDTLKIAAHYTTHELLGNTAAVRLDTALADWADGPAQLRELHRLRDESPLGQHPELPVDEWQREVAGGNTRHGYWEWAEATLGKRIEERRQAAAEPITTPEESSGAIAM